MSLWRKALKKVAKAAVDATGRAIHRVLADDPEPEPPDPFAKLKAAERAKKKQKESP